MNILICCYNSIKYELNKNGVNPALISYNGRIYLREILELLLCKKSDEDKIFLLLSERNALVDRLIKRYEEINIVYERVFSEKIEILKKDCCMFLHTDELFTKEDIEKFLEFVSKNNLSNVVSKRIESNNDEVMQGMFKLTSETLNNLNENEFKKLCSIEYINSNLVLNISEKFYLQDSIIGLENKDMLLNLYDIIDFPRNENIPSLFRKAAKKYPDKIAVTYLDKTITYRELDYITDVMASKLIERKEVCNKSNVGILMERSIEFIICIIGILKAGMMYIPMSKLYPEGRLKMIYTDGDLNCIITDSKTNYYKLYSEECVLYETLIKEKIYDVHLPDIDISPEDTAYIMFTSGSTGNPKGVRISHRNIINNAFFLDRKVFGNKTVKPKNYGVIAEFVFDMSVQQIYPALLFGNNLNIFPGSHNKSPKKLIEFLNKVDTSDATPIILQIITDYIETKNNQFSRDVHLVVGGEKLQYELCKRYFAVKEKSEITNIYGPTECTVEVSTFYLNKDIVNDLDEIPIGKAADNSRIYVLDENNKFVSTNEVGEICVAGECVGHGYINSKESNKKYYINDVLSNLRMYKTGDYGFWDDSGELCFVGRKDKQVKVRGLRIDLGDIESVLEKYTPIIEARVFVDDNKDLGEKIVAYFISKNDNMTLPEIIDPIKEYLPSYMIPSFFIPLKMIPLNVSGKLDKSKLPDLSFALKNKTEHKLSYSAEDKDTKKIVNYISSHFSIFNNDFYDYSLGEIGCDSLNMLLMLTFLYEEFGVEFFMTMISMEMKISELIKMVKENVKKEKDYVLTKEKYKKVYKCVPMQNYILDLEYSNLMLYGESKNINTMIYVWNLDKNIDCIKLKEAIIKVIEKNDAFFMKFHYGENGSKAFYTDKSNVIVESHEVDDINEETILRLIPEFDFKKTPLAYFAIIKHNNEIYLLTAVHHVIFDYISGVSLMKNIESYYYSEKCQETSFFKNLELLNKQKNSINYTNSKNKLFNYYCKTNSIKFNKQSKNGFDKIEKCVISLSSDISSKVRHLCKKYSLSEFYVYIATFFKTLNSILHQEEMTVASFVNGRNMVIPINTIGFFSRYVPITYLEKGNSLIRTAKTLEDEWMKLQKLDNSIEMYDVLNEMKEPCNVLFDYQKMYNSSKGNSIYTKVDTYDLTRISLDFVFRLYDFKDFIEVRIEYMNVIDSKFIKKFIKEYEKKIGELDYE